MRSLPADKNLIGEKNMKTTIPWYKSKIVWLGIITTLLGALEVVRQYVTISPFDANTAILVFSGILTVVLRVWFTNSVIVK